jgi:hypothetical protein
LAVALGGACTKKSPNIPVDIDTEVNVCLTGGKPCYALGVPEASVEIADSSGRVLVTGTTDNCGRVRLSAPKSPANGRLTIRSPLFKGGLVETQFSQLGESSTSVTIRGDLVPGAAGT